MIGNILERRISGINGRNQRASRINEHLSACALPKRNIVHRGNFASIPCWTSFTAIFPLASSVDTASEINGQQQQEIAMTRHDRYRQPGQLLKSVKSANDVHKNANRAR